MPVEQTGVAGKISDTLNDIFELSERTAKELERISKIVGKDGKTTQRASLAGAGGSWAGYMDSVNVLIDDLINPSSEVSRVVEAVAKGDLTQKVALEIEGVPLKGLFLKTAKTVNTMVASWRERPPIRSMTSVSD